MAEGFEPYHVPQQSRRDKLRVNNQPPGCVDNIQGCAALVPLYDPSLISSDLINCDANVHRPSFGVKEEGMNLMGFSGQGINANNHMYLDPQLSVHLNPSTIHDINNSSSNPYAYFRGVLDHHHQSIQEPINSSCNNSGQSLSLSLSSHHSAHNLPLELNLHRYDSNSMFDNNSNNNNSGNKVSGGGFLVACNNGGSTSIELSKSAVPLGPFTGYASVLRGSRFLKPAQQLLEELCDVGRGIYAEKNSGADSSLLDPPPLESLDDSLNSSDGAEQTRKKSRLLSMLDEVYKRYKQYYQQMQAAVAAFESVAGLSNAAPFANLALKAMSKHFRCLKNAITAQLQFTSKTHGKINSERSDDTQRMETSGRGAFGQRPFHNAGFVDQPVWRPQRGLPERAVTVLRAWLFEHFLHPYPTDTDKILLAKQTGLSRNQVSNWFINARVRLWKPMVEEIHMLETRQTQKPSSESDQEQPPPNKQTNQIPTSIECENASTSFQRFGDTFPNLKRTRGDDPGGNTVKSPYDNLLHNNNPHLGIGVSNGGVSLTLGLHQNGGVGLSDSYPINAARRFGLDSSHGGEGYVVSGFAAQNRQFGRDHHHQIIEGQLMHDFVG